MELLLHRGPTAWNSLAILPYPFGGRYGDLGDLAPTNGVIEIRAGTYVVMDDFPRDGARFRTRLDGGHVCDQRASRTSNRGRREQSVQIGGGQSLARTDLEVLRFDEEHGVFAAGPEAALPVGTLLRMVPRVRAGDDEHARCLSRRERGPGS